MAGEYLYVTTIRYKSCDDDLYVQFFYDYESALKDYEESVAAAKEDYDSTDEGIDYVWLKRIPLDGDHGEVRPESMKEFDISDYEPPEEDEEEDEDQEESETTSDDGSDFKLHERYVVQLPNYDSQEYAIQGIHSSMTGQTVTATIVQANDTDVMIVWEGGTRWWVDRKDFAVWHKRAVESGVTDDDAAQCNCCHHCAVTGCQEDFSKNEDMPDDWSRVVSPDGKVKYYCFFHRS